MFDRSKGLFPTNTWYLERYEEGDFGLKVGDGIPRSVPQGSSQEWGELCGAMREGIPWWSKRLSYQPGLGIFCPRNVGHSSEVFITDDPDLIHRLREQAGAL